MDTDIRRALTEHRIIEFSYHGLSRVAEPHVYGMHDGHAQLLTYQVGGESHSGGIPEWRRVNLDEVSALHVIEQRFPGRRPNPSGRHSEFDVIIAVVS